ncbi:MAG: caspase family protein, partial [Candidatus Eremiobacteraeota bacterium]|nr:caspase family protein [Candidatus Eremiobacteraeota bacterium]
MSRPRALIVGIDDYETQKLTSAVNDAVAFRSALIDLGLVAPADITFLTSPQHADAAGPATKGRIKSA